MRLRHQMPKLTKDDQMLLYRISDVQDGGQLATLLHEYYKDADRADRTPREFLYYHLGQLIGLLKPSDPMEEIARAGKILDILRPHIRGRSTH